MGLLLSFDLNQFREGVGQGLGKVFLVFEQCNFLEVFLIFFVIVFLIFSLMDVDKQCFSMVN